MANCLTWNGYKQRPKSLVSSYEKCFLLMMLCWSATRRPSVPHRQIFKSMQRICTHHKCKKTEVIAQNAEIPSSIYIDGFNLSVVDNFKYLESTICHTWCGDKCLHWVSLGRTEFQIPVCWRRPNAQANMLYSAKDAWVTYAGWEKEWFQKTSSMVSLKGYT